MCEHFVRWDMLYHNCPHSTNGSGFEFRTWLSRQQRHFWSFKLILFSLSSVSWLQIFRILYSWRHVQHAVKRLDWNVREDSRSNFLSINRLRCRKNIAANVVVCAWIVKLLLKCYNRRVSTYIPAPRSLYMTALSAEMTGWTKIAFRIPRKRTAVYKHPSTLEILWVSTLHNI